MLLQLHKLWSIHWVWSISYVVSRYGFRRRGGLRKSRTNMSVAGNQTAVWITFLPHTSLECYLYAPSQFEKQILKNDWYEFNVLQSKTHNLSYTNQRLVLSHYIFARGFYYKVTYIQSIFSSIRSIGCKFQDQAEVY